MLPELIEKYDSHHAYWPSSPSNGKGDLIRGLVRSNDPNRGDSHFWKVWHRNAPFTAYRKFDSRFMSEYGFESFPSIKTIREFCPPEQFQFDSPIMENHQKNRAGNKKIMRYMKKRFSIPEKFENQVILSQITHAEAMEYGIENWRRKRNNFHCMGSLYWQLNDCWPVASWSSLDYYLRWKALHYVAKRCYQPFYANVKEEKEIVEFWIINDYKEKRNGNLSWKIMSSEGITLLEGSKSAEVSPCTSLLIEKIDVKKINKKKKYRNNIIFYSLRNKANEIIYRGFRLFDHPKRFSIRDPELSYAIKSSEKQEYAFKITISSKSIALYVFIESKSLDFVASDNYFSMQPGESREINIRLSDNKLLEDTSIKDKINEMLEVKSLFDLI